MTLAWLTPTRANNSSYQMIGIELVRDRGRGWRGLSVTPVGGARVTTGLRRSCHLRRTEGGLFSQTATSCSTFE